MARKPGKYDHLLPNLPKTTGLDASYQDRVELEKAKLRRCTTCKGTGAFRPLCDCGQGDAQEDLEYHASDCVLRLPHPDAVCDACKGTGRRVVTALTLGIVYAKQRAERDIMEATLSQLNCELEASSQMLIASEEKQEDGWGAYGAAGNALRLTNGDGMRVQPEIYPVVFDKHAFRNWLISRTVSDKQSPEYRAAILNSIASNSLTSKLILGPKDLTAFIKERMLNGEPEPDGVKIFVKSKIVFSELKTETAPSDGESETL